MSIFADVKQHISAKEVAQGYGLKVSDKGMACCPFHDDRHPSMKIDSGYYCFACGAKGDANNYAASLFSLSQYDAAQKIIRDFNLPVKISSYISSSPDADFRWQKEKQKKERIDLIKKRFGKWSLETISKLQTVNYDIESIKAHYKRAPPDEVLASDDYAEVLRADSLVGYWLDVLCMGTEEEQQELFLKTRRRVMELEETISDTADRILGRNRKDNGGGNAGPGYDPGVA